MRSPTICFVLYCVFSVAFLVACSSAGPENNSNNIGSNLTGLILHSIGNKVVLAGERISFSLPVSNNNGESLLYSSDGNAGIGLNPYMQNPAAQFDESNGQFTWTTEESLIGVYTVSFTVTDANTLSASDSELISINVLNLYNFGKRKYQQHCQGCHGIDGSDGGATLVQCASASGISEALGLATGISAARNMGSIATDMENVSRDVTAISHFLMKVASC